MMPLRASPAASATIAQPHYDARELIGEGSTALIALDGQIYVLRITRSGKLILTK